jgi:hypothetical protein
LTGLGHLSGLRSLQRIRIRRSRQIKLRVLSILGHCTGRRLTWNAHGRQNRDGRLIRNALSFKPELHCTLLASVRDYRFHQLRVIVRVDLDNPKIVLVRLGGNLLGVVCFGVLDEDHILSGILEPANEHELVEDTWLGLRSCRGDQSKRVSFPEVAVPIRFEPDRNLIIGGRKIEDWRYRQPHQAKPGKLENSIGEPD